MRNYLTDETRDRINRNVKYLLTKNNMSQSDFAKEIDKSVTRVNGVLNGHGSPTLEFVLSVASFFNVKLDELVYTNMCPDAEVRDNESE